MVGIEQVDPAVHEAEAVRRADDRVARDVQDRPAMDRHAGQVAAMGLPGISQIGLDGGEDDLHNSTSMTWT
jgi:hypothetical protein